MLLGYVGVLKFTAVSIYIYNYVEHVFHGGSFPVATLVSQIRQPAPGWRPNRVHKLLK